MSNNHNFGSVFDSVAERFDHITDLYAFERRHHAVLPYLKGKILNVGAGTGILKHLEDSTSYALYMDLSFNMCNVIKRKNARYILCGHAEALPFPDNSFDTVVSLEMVYYLKSPGRFFKEAYRILNPGGVLVVTSANHSIAKFYDFLRFVLRKLGIKNSYFDDPVAHFMTKKELKAFFYRTGFEIIAERNMLTIPFKWMKYLDELIERTPLNRLSMFISVIGMKANISGCSKNS